MLGKLFSSDGKELSTVLSRGGTLLTEVKLKDIIYEAKYNDDSRALTLSRSYVKNTRAEKQQVLQGNYRHEIGRRKQEIKALDKDIVDLQIRVEESDDAALQCELVWTQATSRGNGAEPTLHAGI